MTTTFVAGDIVKMIPVEAKVNYVNDNGSLDLTFLDKDADLDYVPADKVTLVRKRPPAEPAVGAVVKYKSSFGGVDFDYIRTSAGWASLKSGVIGTSTCKWTDFDHRRTYLYMVTSTPVGL